jgi:hypothetical protein
MKRLQLKKIHKCSITVFETQFRYTKACIVHTYLCPYLFVYCETSRCLAAMFINRLHHKLHTHISRDYLLSIMYLDHSCLFYQHIYNKLLSSRTSLHLYSLHQRQDTLTRTSSSKPVPGIPEPTRACSSSSKAFSAEPAVNPSQIYTLNYSLTRHTAYTP